MSDRMLVLSSRAIVLVAFLAISFSASGQSSQPLASTPPMGWNSWDAYGFTIDEADYKANTQVLAGMKQYGWQYSVIDEGWYMRDPFGKDLASRRYLLDANGQLIPDPARFPSAANGAGFKPLADWVHSLGLKFGIHIVRGIPKQAVRDNLPVAGSQFHAADAADTAETCPWDDGNYGVRDNAAGQAWYDSMLSLYARWGLDYIKVDCISDHPYRPTEIRQIAEAIRKTGRPIVLSLSPGPTQLDHAAEVAKYAQMWRITDDHWDFWTAEHKGASEFPFPTRQEFDRIAKWQPYRKPGNWPDPDMLPFGSLTPHPGWGDPRESRLTHDEERSEFTLWAISRSPLILGANLTKLDDFTRSLLINKEVTSLNQQAVESGEGLMPKNDGEPLPYRCWYARSGGAHPKRYAAVFNLGDQPLSQDIPWLSFHLEDNPHAVYDIWKGRHLPSAKSLHVELPAHGSALFIIQ